MADLLMRQGRYLDAWGKWNNALRAYQHAQEKKTPLSKGADFLGYYASVRHKLFGHLAEAKTLYMAGLALDPRHPDILSGLVSLYLDMQEQNQGQGTEYVWKARETFNQLRKIWEEKLQTGKDSVTFLKLGALLLKLEEYEKAEKYLRLALEQTPTTEDEDLANINNLLGILFIRQKLFQRAVRYFEAAHRENPDDLMIWSNLAEAYFKNGQREKAEEEYHRILRITEGSVDSHIGLGEVYSAMGDSGDEDLYQQAIDHFRRGPGPLVGAEGARKY